MKQSHEERCCSYRRAIISLLPFPPLPAVLLMLSSEESQFWIAFYDLFFDRQMMYWYYWKKNNKKEASPVWDLPECTIMIILS